MSKYTDYQFKPFLRDAIAKLGFTEPTPIQKEIIPLILKEKAQLVKRIQVQGKHIVS